MRYTKHPLTFEKQADRLIKRGLITEKQHLISILQGVNYYRLSAYLYPFRNDDDTYKPNTTFEEVWNRYLFDHQLRLILMDAIEWIEVDIRTKITYYLSHSNGAFNYHYKRFLPKLSNSHRRRFINSLILERKISKETFVAHFGKKYDTSYKFLPLWMATEIMSFGNILTLFRGVETKLKQQIASEYGVSDTVFISWFKSLHAIRNIVAHHSRLWNKELGLKPEIPRVNKHPQWHVPIQIQNNRVFCIIMIMKYLLNQMGADDIILKWKKDLNKLIKDNPQIPLLQMGFPENWESCPIWKNNK